MKWDLAQIGAGVVTLGLCVDYVGHIFWKIVF